MEGCPLLGLGTWRNIIFREKKKLMLVISFYLWSFKQLHETIWFGLNLDEWEKSRCAHRLHNMPFFKEREREIEWQRGPENESDRNRSRHMGQTAGENEMGCGGHENILSFLILLPSLPLTPGWMVPKRNAVIFIEGKITEFNGQEQKDGRGY